MTSVQRNRTTHPSRHVAQGFFAAALAMLGGCSADVTRFDFPAFNLTESSNTQTGSLPRAGSEPLAQRGAGYYDGPRGAGLGEEAGRGYQPQQPYPYQGGRGQPSSTATELAPIADRTPPDRTAMRAPDRLPERAAAPERRYEAPRPAASGEFDRGAAGRYPVRDRQAARRAGRRADRRERPAERGVPQAGPAAAAARRRHAGPSRDACAGRQPSGDAADPAAYPDGRHRHARLGRPLHPAAGRLALQHRAPTRHDAGRPAARQRHHRSDQGARRHGAAGAGPRPSPGAGSGRRRSGRRACARARSVAHAGADQSRTARHADPGRRQRPGTDRQRRGERARQGSPRAATPRPTHPPRRARPSSAGRSRAGA